MNRLARFFPLTVNERLQKTRSELREIPVLRNFKTPLLATIAIKLQVRVTHAIFELEFKILRW